jgi:hypothetical protein
MRAVALAAFWLSTTIAAAAASPTPADVFRAVGLFGTWAVDCSRPASLRNPYVNNFVDETGAVVQEGHFGARYAVNHYHIISAKRLSATEVELGVTFQPGDEAGHRQTLVMHVANGRRRTMFNQPADGKVRVRDGVVLGAGVKTPTLMKCE